MNVFRSCHSERVQRRLKVRNSNDNKLLTSSQVHTKHQSRLRTVAQSTSASLTWTCQGARAPTVNFPQSTRVSRENGIIMMGCPYVPMVSGSCALVAASVACSRHHVYSGALPACFMLIPGAADTADRAWGPGSAEKRRTDYTQVTDCWDIPSMHLAGCCSSPDYSRRHTTTP